jgi:hypothetical protein
MRHILALVTIAVLAGGLPARAAEPAAKDAAPATSTHTAASMMTGHHRMPANKHDHMSNTAMQALNPKCSDEALAKMPADHRAACNKPN